MEDEVQGTCSRPG